MKNKLIVYSVLFMAYGFRIYAQEMPISPKTEEVKDFTMTIVDKGGKEKAAVSGSIANILQNGMVEIMGVVARIYGQESGMSDTLVHTTKGMFNRLQNIVTTDQFVRINKLGMVITGIGLEWTPDVNKIKICENAKVEYLSFNKSESVIQQLGGPQIGSMRNTVITSRGGGVMNYGNDTAVFKKDVVVLDQDAILKAHRMKIFFDDKTQQVKTVEAYGDVKIKQPKRKSSSRKAIYYTNEDRIVLSGYPKIEQGSDYYTAEKVTIYDKGNRVVFQPKAQLIIYMSTEHEL